MLPFVMAGFLGRRCRWPLETGAATCRTAPALQKIAADTPAAADKSPKDAEAQYRVAVAANSYLAEVCARSPRQEGG